MLDYFTQSPLSHSNTSKLPPKNYWNDTQATMLRHFTAKAPFTHRFQITGKFCDIINQKWPLNGCASRCCVYKHGGVYVVSIFVDVFIFVSNVHIHAAGFGPETSYDGFKLNYTVCGLNASSTSECYDWPRAVEFWIECYDWPRVHVLRQCLLNLYMLKPVRPLTLSLKFLCFFFFFRFVILSYQNACYGCENAENGTWSDFYFLRQTKVSEAVCKRDWHNSHIYFLTCENFRREFRTQCAKTCNLHSVFTQSIILAIYW